MPNLLIVLYIAYFVHDVVPHYLCCDGKYFSGCDLYYEKRPNDNCSEYPARPPPGMSVQFYIIGINFFLNNN